jgi:hypothetical protein
MKAPNGKPTNLTERQWVQVRTPAFKKWFGDWESDPANASKVLDENGEPMVVHHGTPTGGFNIFDKNKMGARDHGYFGKGFYFTPQEQIAKYNYTKNRDWSESPQSAIYGVFLKLKNPKIVSELDESTVDSNALSDNGYDGIMFLKYLEYSESEREDPLVQTDLKRIAEYGNKSFHQLDFLLAIIFLIKIAFFLFNSIFSRHGIFVSLNK